MKYRPLCILFLSVLIAAPLTGQQTTTIPREGAERLHVKTLFGGVELMTYDGTAIEVTHTVTVNGKAYPDLAELTVSRADGELRIEEIGPTGDDLHALQQGNGDRNTNSQIKLIVRVPNDLVVTLETLYGGVDATDVPRLREVNSTYGGITVSYGDTGPSGVLELYSNYGAVDLTLPPDASADLELKTQYGELLTDFDLEVDTERSRQGQFLEHVVGTIGGGGARVRCESPYGKVYLRQAEEL
jgi:hypothetical protein